MKPYVLRDPHFAAEVDRISEALDRAMAPVSPVVWAVRRVRPGGTPADASRQRDPASARGAEPTR